MGSGNKIEYLCLPVIQTIDFRLSNDGLKKVVVLLELQNAVLVEH